MNAATKTEKKSLSHRKLWLCLVLLAILVPSSILLSYQFLIVKTSYLDDVTINLSSDFTSLNQSRWITPSYQKNPFMFEVETYTKDNKWWTNATYSVNYYTMGTTDWFKDNCTQWGEWGYSFHHLTNGTVDGAGVTHYGGFPTPPATKVEAYNYMRDYVINFTKHINNDTRPWVSFNGHYPYHHYAAEFGFDAIGSEIGENMESHQMMMAFNRGAARQYNLPWFVDYSAWYGGGITDYNNPTSWPDYGGPNNGHSLSQFRRCYYMSYMAGASRIIAEGGYANYFYLYGMENGDGLMRLTPLGEVGREFVNFTQHHPNRGIPYTPIGLYIDEYHGTTGFANRDRSKIKAFNSVPYNEGDFMTYDLLEMLFPGGWISKDDETYELVNSEFGDIFDVILQNASENVLASYPILLMSGDIQLDDTETARLIQYVKNGGTLLVNSAYFDSLNLGLQKIQSKVSLKLGANVVKVVPFDNDQGGQFILYGPKFDPTFLLPVLRELKSRISPFQLFSLGPLASKQGRLGADVNIEYMINRNENGWILTLINNDGVKKTPKNPPTIDPSQKKYITITLNAEFITKQMPNKTLQSITNWNTNETLWSKEQSTNGFPGIRINIDPGDLAVLEFQFQ